MPLASEGAFCPYRQRQAAAARRPAFQENVWCISYEANIVLRFNRNPDLESAGAGLRVEFLAVALEFRPSRRAISGFGQRLVPDRKPRLLDGRNMITLREYHIALLRDAQPAEFRLDAREVGHLDARHVF